MLYNLDFLTPGQYWIPASEKERLEKYTNNKKLFDCKHEEVYQNWIDIFNRGNTTIPDQFQSVINIPKRISTLWSDLILGEKPRFKVDDKNKDWIFDLEENNDMIQILSEVIIDMSRFGVGLIKVRYDDFSIIESVSPLIWFPVVYENNIKEIQYHVLAWVSSDKKTLTTEIHEKGKYTIKTLGLKDGKIVSEISEEVYITGCKDFLVIPSFNLRTSDSPFGIDDYQDLDSPLQSLEMLVGKVLKILDKHSDPNIAMPSSLADTDEDEYGNNRMQMGGKVFITEAGEQLPSYITWDPKLESNFTMIDKLMDIIYILSQTSKSLFGDTQNGTALSGSAMKRQLISTLAKISKLTNSLDRATKRAIKLAGQLDRRDVQISIEWQDGVPSDPLEQSQIESTRKSAGLTSTVSALKRLDGSDDKEAEMEAQRIKEDEALPAPDTPNNLGGADLNE